VVDVALDENFRLSARNIRGVTLVPSGRLTARDVMNNSRIIATRAAVERLQEVLG
jgi:large subunit ribosomal protein L4